jgi:hypothetical protein
VPLTSNVRRQEAKVSMSKKSDEEYQKNYQEAYDWLAVSCYAATSAKGRFRKVFDEVAKRGIAEKKVEHPETDVVHLDDVYFVPSDMERQAMREAYMEWQAYKLLWEEKQKELSISNNMASH